MDERPGQDAEARWAIPRDVVVLLGGLVAAFLVSDAVVLVAGWTGWARVAAALVTEALLATAAAVLVTRRRMWREIGFRRLATPRDLRFYWIPALPTLLALLPATLNPHDLAPGMIAAIALLAVLVGFVEETFLRGLVLRWLLPGGRWRAVLVSALAFGLLHALNVVGGADPGSTALQVVYATGIGVGFAAVTLRTGVLWPLVVLHATTDLAGFVAIGATSAPHATLASAVASLVWTALFVGLGVVVLRGMDRREREAPQDAEPKAALT
ncbi:MAG: CPBP family intramembrane metalloprotease [Cellulomonadaceae bacterium]|nr:CPBP family intramembrane metalloprotease [Cellulomonadaceae bacterium]